MPRSGACCRRWWCSASGWRSSPTIVTELVVHDLPAETAASCRADRLGLVSTTSATSRAATSSRARSTPEMRAAADHLREPAAHRLRGAGGGGACRSASSAAAIAWRQISPRLRARNRVETIVTGLLISASTIAIFTTIGIVLSVLFESIRFFQHGPADRFPVRARMEPADGACAPTRSARPGPSAPCRCSPARSLISGIAMLVAVPDRPDVGDLPVGIRQPRAFAPSPSRCWRFWRASRPWSTASSPP